MPDLMRVIVVDDQALFSAGLGMLIEAQDDMECVGTALNGREAVRLAERLRPDIILMDLRMPVVNGLEATKQILSGGVANDAPCVIVLTTTSHDDAVYAAFRAGASAFLTKDASPETVLATIRDTHAGVVLPSGVASVGVVEEFMRRTDSAVNDAPLDKLTPREREVFVLVARGLSNAEIADAVYLSETTVKTHVSAVLQKLDLRSRVHVVVFAYENRLIGR